MNINIPELKKKIIYRSAYRGTKEMDSLISSFVKKYINDFNEHQLLCLLDLINIDDENLYKINQNKTTSIDIKDNEVTKLFKKFIYIK
tara:strand:+ start:303 stop:566 length:264 start_codon:yes stop_codon:yes gene_type:complete